MRTRAPRVPEKAEQQHGVGLLRTLGARVYVLGHSSPNDGRGHRGTGQTPGLSDVYALLPGRVANPPRRALWWEVKGAGGRLRPEQIEFRELNLMAGVAHVVGTYDDLIAWLIAHGYLKAEQVPHYRQPGAVA